MSDNSFHAAGYHQKSPLLHTFYGSSGKLEARGMLQCSGRIKPVFEYQAILQAQNPSKLLFPWTLSCFKA